MNLRNLKECIAVLIGLYLKKNGAVSCVKFAFHLIWPLYPVSWPGFDCGQISIETATHSLVHKAVSWFNPHANMWGPCGPRKTLIAAQTIAFI